MMTEWAKQHVYESYLLGFEGVECMRSGVMANNIARALGVAHRAAGILRPADAVLALIEELYPEVPPVRAFLLAANGTPCSVLPARDSSHQFTFRFDESGEVFTSALAVRIWNGLGRSVHVYGDRLPTDDEAKALFDIVAKEQQAAA